MKAMSSDWLKLARGIIDSRVFASEGMLKVWIWCLCRAAFKRRFVSVTIGRGSTEVELQPGQFIFGRKTAAQKLGMDESTVYDRMRKLVRMGNISMQSNTNFSIVTICNWSSYQDESLTDQQPTQQPGNSRPTAKQQPSNTIEESKEGLRMVEEGSAPAGAVAPARQPGLFGEDAVPPSKPTRKRKPKPGAPPIEVPKELDVPEFRAAWIDWVEHRRGLGQPLSRQTQLAQLTEFVEWGVVNAIASIREAIRTGFGKLWYPRNGQGGRSRPGSPGINGHSPGRVRSGNYDHLEDNAGPETAVNR
jgi:hypothetical protein